MEQTCQILSFKSANKMPNQLADNILNLEFEIDMGEVDQEKIAQLLSYYSEAIGYYWELKDDRHKLFQEKIKKLFLNKEVERCLKKKSMKDVTSHQINIKVQEANTSAYEQAKTLIKQYRNIQSKHSEKVQNLLSNQKQNILERVRARSNSKSKKNNKDKQLRALQDEFIEMRLNK